MVIEKVLYTAKTRTTGGREGNAKSSDEKLDILLTPPGLKGKGTNPEQLFAAGWSACYIGALGLAAKEIGILLPKDTYVDAEVDLGMTGDAYFLQARLFVSMPGIKKETVEKFIEMAHQICPYSKAIQGNINISTTII
ncbi:organic hydroperoxide resistance protein [Chryseobacterium sp. Mn2064]|uniref:organic hydroperoxide resistance protein n=1 Tax=Chryseobacterium sp. Mn2064 TaxID=3395263 RepID=UPI003BEA6763